MLEQIKKDQLDARKARDSFTARLLTTVIGEATMPGKETDIIKVITKFIKNAREMEKLGNIESSAEIKLLEKYLPTQMEEMQLTFTIIGIKATLENPNIGAIMKILNKQYSGKFDNKLAVDIIRASA